MTDPVPKGGWRTNRFDEMASMINDRIDNPEEASVDRYVGLEHLDPDSLRIRRWGTPSDVTATKLLFRKGDIIFGRRRVYQRKLAVADFDGICSAHAMVLRAKPDVVLPEFLPFFMQSDMFMERAKEISVGSLSPTINWKSLAKEEFALPPLDEQRRIALLLAGASDLVNAHLEAAETHGQLIDGVISASLDGRSASVETLRSPFGGSHSSVPLVDLSDLVRTFQYGISIRGRSEGRYGLLRMTDLQDGQAVEGEQRVDLSKAEFDRYRLRSGDVLFNRTNSHDLVGRSGVYRLTGDHVVASYLIRLRVDERVVVPEFLCSYLNHPLGRQQVLRFATRAVSQSNVNVNSLRRIQVPLPTLASQHQAVETINALRSSHEAHILRAAAARELIRLASNRLGDST